MTEPLMRIENLEKYFEQRSGIVDTLLGREADRIQAVDGVSLTIDENEVIGVIGESGCGKSTLLRTLIGLESPTGGDIIFKEREISDYDRSDWEEFRNDVQIIFQDPFNTLDPKMTVRETLLEPLKIHDIDDREEHIRQTLIDVELQSPEQYLSRLPDQLSGGEKQRISIARALVLEPDLLLADEPVSMLDVSTQASILRLLSNLTDKYGLAMLYISHDLSTVAHVCDIINVMYLGRIIESGPTLEVLNEPKHPYTQELMKAIPIPDPHHNRERTGLEGAPRDPINLEKGCRFRDRCPERMDVCEKTPRMVDAENHHTVACHLYYDHRGSCETE